MFSLTLGTANFVAIAWARARLRSTSTLATAESQRAIAGKWQISLTAPQPMIPIRVLPSLAMMRLCLGLHRPIAVDQERGIAVTADHPPCTEEVASLDIEVARPVPGKVRF